MSVLPSLEVAEFPAFFRAVHSHDPFPWQVRLSRQVTETGWPDVLELPTGTGKTAALDVAVFALALNAGRAPRVAPLRIIYVVDRRTIVDQAFERARKIKRALDGAEDDVVRRVRERLARFADEGAPLRTALLRGGIARDDMWARTPDQPLIAVSTVDQVGSRLLFRGYGVSDYMKAVHAGLLGCDVLYLLDEVHLSQPFRETLAAVGTRYRGWAEKPLPGPFVVVEMSATPGGSPGSVFRIDDRDRENAVLLKRMQASKPATLVSTNARGFSKELEKHVTSMLTPAGATVAAVVNRVKSARELHARLCDTVPGGSSAVHLLTGRMRPFDRDVIERSLLERIRAGRTPRSLDNQPTVVVATQSIEAGADFDFDGLVSECASLDALRQRFGRLDRLGELAGSARGVIVVRTDTLEEDPVYGDAIGKTWTWLREHADGAVVDFGIDNMVVPPDAEGQGLLAPKAHAPILLPSHLDAWVQTAPMPDPDPDVALWLHGPKNGVADLQIVWRSDLTEALLKQANESGPAAEHAAEIAIGMVEALPPVSAEAMSVPFVAATCWLEGRSEPDSADVEGAADPDLEAADGKVESAPRPAIVWQGEQSRVIAPAALRPGQTIIVPASYGGIDHHNWAPASTAPVQDVAEIAACRQGRRPTLRLHHAVLRNLFEREIAAPKPGSVDSEGWTDRDVVITWLKGADASTAARGLRDLLDLLRKDMKWLRVERLTLAPGEEAEAYFVITGRRRRVRLDDDITDGERASTEDSMSSFTGVEVTLADHLAGVAETAAGFAERLGLPDDLVADLRLAGAWHDAGKADPRFQRWLYGGSEFKALTQSEPLAKSRTLLVSPAARRVARERAEYPKDARHELTSLVLIESAGDSEARANDWNLVRHLIASHHGYCRPLAPWAPDPNPVQVNFSRDGIMCHGSSAHDLARLDSGIAERFWQMARKYGWWGLAWMETLLRLADHRQSEREQVSKEAHDA